MKNKNTNNEVIENNTMFNKIKKAFHKETPDFTAEFAWIETTYGEGSFHTLEERIKSKQERIVHLIKSNFPPHIEGLRSCNTNSSYRCVVDIEEDLMCCVDEIFQPFVDGGFKIINLSEQIPEIANENVYLISWKKVFMRENNSI